MADGTAAARPRRKTRRAEASPTTTDAIEIAMEAERLDGRPDSPARRVLLQHERLLRWQVASETASFGLKILTGVVGVAASVVLAWLAWDASQARTLIVEPFRTPQDFAARGLDGIAVANQVLDRLSAMQAKTDTARAASSFQNNWGDGIKVAIPNTGVSLDDLQRLLRDWLGRETHISGEVFRTPGGLTVTARVGDASAEPFSGREAEFDKLISSAAESIYRRTQPYRYAIWLSGQERRAEAKALLEELGQTGPLEDRPFALTGLANLRIAEGDVQGAQAAVDEALDKYPDFIKSYWNLGDIQRVQGHDEAFLATRRHILNATAKDERLTQVSRDHVKYQALAYVAAMQGDYHAASEYSALEKTLPEWNGNSWGAALAEIRSGLRAHEVAHVRGLAARSMPLAKSPEDYAVYARRVALETGDFRGIAAPQPAVGPRAPVLDWPEAALVLARMGDIPSAQALIAKTPVDCYACARARGQIAALAGDQASAEHWLGEAIRQGPSLPQAFSELGEVRLARGDRAGAVAMFAQAVERGPRFADPLAYWGDALLADGNPKAAVAKYKAAARLAPNWGRLHVQWGRALAASGEAAEASVHWRKAASLDLSPEDRAWLTRRLAAKPS